MAGEDAGADNIIDGALHPRRRDAAPKIRFALDSPLEGDGVELPVPRAMRDRFGEFALRTSCWPPPAAADTRRRTQPKPAIFASSRACIARGTASSNPSPSSGESGANLTFSIRAGERHPERRPGARGRDEGTDWRFFNELKRELKGNQRGFRKG